MGIVEIIGFGLAVTGFLLAGAVWIHSVHVAEAAATEKKDLEHRLARVETKNKQVEAKAQALSSRTQELEKDLAEAVARRDEKAMASAMWALELERSYRQWRDVIAPDPTSSRPHEATTGQQLAFAISQEVERLREEVGVSIRFEGGLTLELEAETALGALRISEELLALAAKSADEVVVEVEGNDGVIVIVDCAGWELEGDPTSTELGTTVQSMAAKLEGWVQWNRTGEDHLVITVRLPVLAPPPSSAVNDELQTVPAPLSDVSPEGHVERETAS